MIPLTRHHVSPPHVAAFAILHHADEIPWILMSAQIEPKLAELLG